MYLLLLQLTKSRILFPLALAFTATLTGALAGSVVKANAANEFEMLDGSAILIRVNPETDKYGIKFVANVGEKVEGAAYKMMILPTEYVDAYEQDKTEGKKPMKQNMFKVV